MTRVLHTVHLMERRIGWLVGALILLLSYSFLLSYKASSWNQALTSAHAHMTAAGIRTAWTAQEENNSLPVFAQQLYSAESKLKAIYVSDGTKYVYHPQLNRIGGRPNPDDSVDKAIYDATQQMKSMAKKDAPEALYLTLWEQDGSRLSLYEPRLDGKKVVGVVRIDYLLDQTIPLVGWKLPLLLICISFIIYLIICGISGHTHVILGVCFYIISAGGMLYSTYQADMSSFNQLAAGSLHTAAKVVSALQAIDISSEQFLRDLQNSSSPGRAVIQEFNTIALRGDLKHTKQDTPGLRIIDSSFRDISIQGVVDETNSARLLFEIGKLNFRLLPVSVLMAIGIWMFIAGGKAVSTGVAIKRHRIAYLYIFPASIGLIVLVFFPLLYGVTLAFFRVLYGEWTFVGFKNFIEVLSNTRIFTPGSFYFTFGVTVLWTAVNVILHVSIGLALALTLNRATLKFKRFYRVLLILPWAIPNYITALIWKGMFHQQFGAINAFLQAIGLEPVSWFNSFWTAFFANVLTNTWLGFPFMMVISLGALQSIPNELYEAAEVDGASKFQKFLTITLPLLKPTLFPAIILGTVWTFNMFNIIYLVSGGAPNQSTDILIVEAYRYAFQRSAWGIAAAYSIIIFVILWLYSVITNRLVKATEGAL